MSPNQAGGGPIENMNQSPKDLGKDRCAVVLRKALASSGRFRTISELAEATGIPKPTLGGYFTGHRLPNEQAWQKLRRALESEKMDSSPAKAPSTKKSNPSKGTSPAEPGTPSPSAPPEPSPEALAHAAEVRQAIVNLSLQLEYFKQGSSAQRDALRQTIAGRDIGYVTSLLRALYDEDQFETWILFSEYSLGGNEK